MNITLESLDKRLDLLGQSVNLGFQGLRVELMTTLKGLEAQNGQISDDIKDLETRLVTLDQTTRVHEKRIDSMAPWVDGLKKVVWIVIGLAVVAAASGIVWAAVQSSGIVP